MAHNHSHEHDHAGHVHGDGRHHGNPNNHGRAFAIPIAARCKWNKAPPNMPALHPVATTARDH